jgi:dihydrodipicolinate synthase/N-acetylneuraminate lyase
MSTLDRESWTGPWAGLPVAWTDRDEFDEAVYRGDVARCCRAGVPGVYTGGSTGEFYALEFDEFQRVTRATIEECRARNKPAMIGCTSTCTRSAARKAAFAAEAGASAIQVALPFWLEVSDHQIVPFFREVSAASGGLPLSIYETTRAKKTLSLDQHRAVHEALPNYLMVKANAGTIGATVEGCRELSQFANVFVGEHSWGSLGRVGVKGGCSSVVYWNPRIVLGLWQQVERQNWPVVDEVCAKLSAMFKFLFDQFSTRGFTDTAFDRLGGINGGFLQTSLRCRAPYPYATPRDVEALRQWYREHWPEMLDVASGDHAI